MHAAIRYGRIKEELAWHEDSCQGLNITYIAACITCKLESGSSLDGPSRTCHSRVGASQKEDGLANRDVGLGRMQTNR
jgi:hypothetical protein